MSNLLDDWEIKLANDRNTRKRYRLSLCTLIVETIVMVFFIINFPFHYWAFCSGTIAVYNIIFRWRLVAMYPIKKVPPQS